MTTYFEILNNFMGIGEPSGGIWFVGLEEAYQWSKDIEYDKGIYDRYKNRCFCVDPGEIAKNAKEYGNKFTKIYDIMSKVLVGLQNDPDECDGWKRYRDNILFQKGSGVFQANLYPLGKKRLDEWPSHYEKIFGLGKSDIKKYLSLVREQRFPSLRAFWKESSPLSTICFGVAGWDDFVQLFELDKEVFEEEDLIRTYKKQRIIFTLFFDYRHMNHRRINRVVNSLKVFKRESDGRLWPNCAEDLPY